MKASAQTTAWCGHCKDEAVGSKPRQQPGKLGHVRRRGGIARWFTTDPRWHGKRRAGGWPARFDVSQVLLGDDRDPMEVKVFCRWHGAGVVATHEVTSASGNVTLYFKATR